MIKNIALIAGLFVFRIDAFLSNIIDFLFIGLYVLFVYVFSGFFSGISYSVIQGLVMAILISHFLYSIVYVINDFMDYSKTKINQFGSNSIGSSFYALRPIFHFARRKSLLLYFVGLYLLILSFVLLAVSAISYEIFAIIVCLTILSFWHSICVGLRRVFSFFFLRILKYILFVALFAFFTSFNEFVSYIIAFSLIIPYLFYVTSIYFKQKNIKKFQFKKNTILLLMASIALCVYFLIVSVVLNFMFLALFSSLIAGYLIVVTPFLGVKLVNQRFYGSENADFSIHIKRLLTSVLLTTIIAVCEILLVIY